MLTKNKEFKQISKIRFRFLGTALILLLINAIIAPPLIREYFSSREQMGALIEINSIIYEVSTLDQSGSPTELTNKLNYNRTFAFKIDSHRNIYYLSNCTPYKTYISQNFNKIENEFIYQDNSLYVSKNIIGDYIYFAGFDNYIEKGHNISYMLKILAVFYSILFVLFLAFIGVSHLITKPIKDALIKQNNFIGYASHELKTPLSIIKANTELLELEKDNISKYTNNILDETNYMSNIIKDLLELTELTNKKEETKYENVSELLKNIANKYNALATENNINYSLKIEDNLYTYINPKDFRKLIVSLISNSFNYVNNKKTIIIDFSKSSNYLDLVIYNTGCDVPEKDSEKIFEKFYKGNVSSSNYGLGLSMVKMICDKYNFKLFPYLKQNEYFAINILIKIKKEKIKNKKIK